MENPEILKRALERERIARKAAEKFLEAKSLELHRANEKLLALNKDLEGKVGERTRELASTTLRLKALIENLQDGILVEDDNRNIAVINHRFCDLFGILAPPSTLLGADCSQSLEMAKDLFKAPESFIEGIDQLLKDRLLKIGEELELADGRFFRRDYIPILRGEKYLGHLWRYMDVTVEKEQKEAIAAVARFPEEAPYGVLRFDTSAKISYSNQVAKVFIGILEIPEFISQQSSFYEKITEVYRGGVKSTWEIELGKNWFQVFFVPFQNNGYINVYVIDNTHLKQIERDLVKAWEAAEASVSAREIFLANMSHEIRTPMNAILGMGRLLDNTRLDPIQERYLNVIRNSSENLMIVVNDILDFSKIEAGMMTIEPKPASLEGVVNFLFSTLNPKALEKGIQFKFRVDPKIPAAVITDAGRLGQILLNLLGNAIKFTEKGSVKIDVSLIPPRKGDLNSILFSVIDTGIGIEENKLNHIFESFQQEDSGTSRKYGGTGLGLAISKRLVGLLGGELKIKSKKWKGSEFYFVLDLETGDLTEEKGSLIEVPKKDALKGKKMLLVEDNLYNRELVIALLEDTGLVIDTANNGLQAIEKLRESSYELILMDIQMPEMGGIEATRIIRKDLKLTTPIIALTANAMEGQKSQYLKAGMDDYLSKPFEPEELFSLISGIIGSNFTSEKGVDTFPVGAKPVLYSTKELLKQGNDNPDFVDRMLNIFCQTTPGIIKKLEESIQNHDFQKACAIIHQLKPSVRMMKIDSIIPEVIQLGSGNPQFSEHPDWHEKANKIVHFLSASVSQVLSDLKG